MRKFRRIGAVLLLLALFCGCAKKQVTAISLPGETTSSAQTQNTPSLEPTASQEETEGKTEEKTLRLQMQRRVPENLIGITTLTVLGDTIIAGGPAEDAPALVRFPTEGGETTALDVPEGTDYLYALCESPDGGFWLLSGTLPAGYLDERGNFKFLSGDPEGKLSISKYDADFSLRETTPLATIYNETGARFFQMTKTETGFALVSASMLVLLDDTGAETARQTIDTNDGWAFAAMQEDNGTLFVLTREMFHGEAPELRAFDEKTLTALEAQTLPLGTVGLGLGEDRTFLLTDSDALSSCDLASGKVQTIALWRELGAKTAVSQVFRTEDGYVLFSPNEEAVSIVLWKAVAGDEKQVLTLAVAADCPVWYEFTQLFESFNLSQEQYRIDYTVYSDAPYYEDGESMDVLRTKIMAGDSPDLFAFYSDGNQASPLLARSVCADLRALLPDVTEERLLPGLFDLLTQDGALYELPLTVRVDTLVFPSDLIDHTGVTLADLEAAREKMPSDWVPVDSWNTPGNLFGLTAPFCIGRFTDLETGTCNFETQEFLDILDWCRRWGGDGSTPEAPEKTLLKRGWISSLSWLSGREDIAKQWFDGAGYTYAGYPVGTGGSAYLVLTSLGVSESCQNLDGAKAFLEYCFASAQQDLPANMQVLREEFAQYKLGNRTDWYGNPETISDADEAKFLELLQSVTVLEGMDKSLEDILCEEANAYFAGNVTAGQAAKTIQSRASVYLLEQYTD